MTQSAMYSDAARRCADHVTVRALIAGNTGKWVAIRLSDGDSDGVVYDTWRDAVRHQLHETQCCYIKIPPDGMTPVQAERYMNIHRALYDGGHRLVDPEAFGAVMPNRMEAYRYGVIHGVGTGTSDRTTKRSIFRWW
jgi:hypothetical protein